MLTYGTDTLEYYANVIEHPNDSIYGRQIAINRNQNILFDVVMFDNGPEPFVEGLTRVLRNGKMGFANKFGQVVIPCKYDFVKWLLKNNCDIDHNLVKKNDSIIASFDIKTILESYWNSMNETDLRKMTSVAYRLTSIHRDGRIKVVRIQKNKNSIELIIKKQLGTTKYRSKPEGVFTDCSKRNLKTNEWNDFIELTNQMNFWTMPVKINKTRLDGDSSFLLLEGITPELNNCTKRNYHMVINETSMDTTNFKKLYDKIYEFGNK